MKDFEKLLIFLCSGAAKAGNKKLSFRIASRIADMGVADIGTIQDLGAQHNIDSSLQKKMIFINDCRAGCVNVITQGFDKSNYLFFDVSPFLNEKNFDVEQYIVKEVFPILFEKWAYPFSLLEPVPAN